MYLNIFSSTTGETISEVGYNVALAIEGVLRDVEKENETMHNMVNELIKSSEANIFEKMKPIEENFNKIYDSLEKKMNGLTNQHKEKIKKLQDESASKVQNMAKKIKKQIDLLYAENNKKIEELEKKIDALQKPQNSSPNIMDAITRDIKQIWESNYGMSLRADLDKIERNNLIQYNQLQGKLQSYKDAAEVEKTKLKRDMQTNLSTLSIEIRDNKQIFENQDSNANACIKNFSKNTGELRRSFSKYQKYSDFITKYFLKITNEKIITPKEFVCQ